MTGLSETLAIIPARGGSKRLPRKNVVDFLGRPMLAWTVDAARASGRFDRVVVSTEDAEIAEAAARAGAEVVERPARLADDAARVVDVCLDLLDSEARVGRRWSRFCCLYATSPLRGAEDVSATLDLLEPPEHGFAMAVTEYGLPPHQALRLGPGNRLEPMWPDLVHRRGDEVGPLRVDNGSTYAADVDSFRLHRSFYGPGLRGHCMPRARSTDVDVPEDLELARWQATRLGLGDA